MRTARVPGNFYKKMRTIRGYPQFGADYLSMDRVFRFDSQTVAALVGFAVMAILGAYNKKARKNGSVIGDSACPCLLA